jgi:hypothetical protein
MRTKDTAKALAPHIEEIARAIRKQVDGKKRGGFGTPNLIVRRSVSRLARIAGTGRFTSHSETFTRALAELQGKELPRASQRREVQTTVATIARWLNLAHLIPQPAPKSTKKLPPPKRIKGVRRIRGGGNWLEEYGIETNDRLLVAMTGEVRPGELGYFEVHEEYHYGTGTHLCHRGFFFLFERKEDCRKEEYYPQAGVCLRTFADRCDGRHVGSREEPTLENHFGYGILESAYTFGRVVGVERAGAAVETTLSIRPYDEREGVTTTLGPTPEQVRPYYPKDGASNGQRLADLKRRLKDLGEEDDQIIRCTERYKLEKEIFDLEHPQDLDDWSAWEE